MCNLGYKAYKQRRRNMLASYQLVVDDVSFNSATLIANDVSFNSATLIANGVSFIQQINGIHHVTQLINCKPIMDSQAYIPTYLQDTD